MQAIEEPPRIRKIDSGRDDLFAFEVTGHVTAADLENMYGLVEGACELSGEIDLLLRIDRYEGLDWAAAFRDSTLAAKAGLLRRVRRYAMVGGPVWMKAAIALVRPFLSVEIRHFETGEEAGAWSWLDSGRPGAA